MERSTQYLGYHTLNKVHALESANVSASAHKVAPSLDPSKPSSSSTCHPPLATSCHAMPPHLMSISDVRLLLHLAARVAPIVVAHLAAPPPRPAPDRPPAPIACQPRGTLAAPHHAVPRFAPRHRRLLLLDCPSRLTLLLLSPPRPLPKRWVV